MCLSVFLVSPRCCLRTQKVSLFAKIRHVSSFPVSFPFHPALRNAQPVEEVVCARQGEQRARCLRGWRAAAQVPCGQHQQAPHVALRSWFSAARALRACLCLARLCLHLCAPVAPLVAPGLGRRLLLCCPVLWQLPLLPGVGRGQFWLQPLPRAEGGDDHRVGAQAEKQQKAPLLHLCAPGPSACAIPRAEQTCPPCAGRPRAPRPPPFA